MKTFGIIVLGLVALFFGGCAVAFLLSPDDEFAVPILIAAGLLIAAASIYGIVRLLREDR